MIYLEYVKAKKDKERAEEIYKKVLREIEDVFELTQPKSVPTDVDKVTSTKLGGPFDNYLAEKERRQLDERLIEARRLLETRERLLDKKLSELMGSVDPEDVIYRERYVLGFKISVIALHVSYSESQVYRILRKIHAKL